jgi:hypothetical protein
MNEDWKASIAKIVHWKQITNENDTLGAFPWHLPRVAGTPGRIAEAEKCAGVPFSASYREFLGLADGWRGFCVTTDLFGTEDFLTGRAAQVRQRPDVSEYISLSDVDARFVVPIGASEADMDVFLLISEASPIQGGIVIWTAGGEVDRYPDFRAFFESMVNYNARLAHQLVAQR